MAAITSRPRPFSPALRSGALGDSGATCTRPDPVRSRPIRLIRAAPRPSPHPDPRLPGLRPNRSLTSVNESLKGSLTPEGPGRKGSRTVRLQAREPFVPACTLLPRMGSFSRLSSRSLAARHLGPRLALTPVGASTVLALTPEGKEPNLRLTCVSRHEKLALCLFSPFYCTCVASWRALRAHLVSGSAHLRAGSRSHRPAPHPPGCRAIQLSGLRKGRKGETAKGREREGLSLSATQAEPFIFLFRPFALSPFRVLCRELDGLAPGTRIAGRRIDQSERTLRKAPAIPEQPFSHR
jgi:hypothetical protein